MEHNTLDRMLSAYLIAEPGRSLGTTNLLEFMNWSNRRMMGANAPMPMTANAGASS